MIYMNRDNGSYTQSYTQIVSTKNTSLHTDFGFVLGSWLQVKWQSCVRKRASTLSVHILEIMPNSFRLRKPSCTLILVLFQVLGCQRDGVTTSTGKCLISLIIVEVQYYGTE